MKNDSWTCAKYPVWMARNPNEEQCMPTLNSRGHNNRNQFRCAEPRTKSSIMARFFIANWSLSSLYLTTLFKQQGVSGSSSEGANSILYFSGGGGFEGRALSLLSLAAGNFHGCGTSRFSDSNCTFGVQEEGTVTNAYESSAADLFPEQVFCSCEDESGRSHQEGNDVLGGSASSQTSAAISHGGGLTSFPPWNPLPPPLPEYPNPPEQHRSRTSAGRDAREDISLDVDPSQESWARSPVASAATLGDDDMSNFDRAFVNGGLRPNEDYTFPSSEVAEGPSHLTGWMDDIQGARSLARDWYRQWQNRHNAETVEPPRASPTEKTSFHHSYVEDDSSSDLEPSSASLDHEQLFEQISDQGGEARPLVYSYFPRSRARSRSDHMPFIFLGPSVDHWKGAGQVLASRGFSVLACESGVGQQGEACDRGKNIVLAVLEALRWKKAVIVGCDSGSVDALQAALALSPDRVAGIILCGNLRDAERFATSFGSAREDQLQELDHSPSSAGDQVTLDAFLKEHVACPQSIIWDGDLYSLRKNKASKKVPVSEDDVVGYDRDLRVVIVGGGRSPHRRLPEQFAWVLSRFVEEKVSSKRLVVSKKDSQGGDGHKKHLPGRISAYKQQIVSPFTESESIQEIFSPESVLVSGRILAAGIMYVMVAKVFLHQYQNVRSGVLVVGSSSRWIYSWQRQFWLFIAKIMSDDWKRKRSFVRSLVRMPHFHQRAGHTRGEETDLRQDNIIVEEPPEEKEEDSIGHTDSFKSLDFFAT